MSEQKEQKNYAALRYSATFGQLNDKIKLAVNREEIIKWFQDMTADAKGIVRVCICPRKTPSPANAFTLFQDTWQPEPSKTGQSAANRQPEAKASVLRDDLQAGLREVKAATEADDVPF